MHVFTQLIIGNGEVGSSLYKYLRKKQDSVFDVVIDDKIQSYSSVFIRDRQDNNHILQYDMLHICYGYSKTFVSDTKKYIKMYSPRYIIIHSSLPIGTTRKINKNAIHSPIRGIHPHIEKSIGVFVKYFGGKVDDILKEWINSTFINNHIVDKPEITEALKLWSTTTYGVSIMLEKEIYRYCKKHKLPFDVIYTMSTESYNKGYTELGCPQYVRPILKNMPGKIGGHCVIQNCKLLDSPIAKKIIRENSKY